MCNRKPRVRYERRLKPHRTPTRRPTVLWPTWDKKTSNGKTSEKEKRARSAPMWVHRKLEREARSNNSNSEFSVEAGGKVKAGENKARKSNFSVFFLLRGHNPNTEQKAHSNVTCFAYESAPIDLACEFHVQSISKISIERLCQSKCKTRWFDVKAHMTLKCLVHEIDMNF